MVSKVGTYVVTEQDKRMLSVLFKDPMYANEFVRLLQSMKRSCDLEKDKIMEVHLLSDDPKHRAMALLQKGRSENLADLITLLENLTK